MAMMAVVEVDGEVMGTHVNAELDRLLHIKRTPQDIGAVVIPALSDLSQSLSSYGIPEMAF